jgi:hypothetical protein
VSNVTDTPRPSAKQPKVRGTIVRQGKTTKTKTTGRDRFKKGR